ncbi:hypothetical protein IED13_04375 [Bosea sp. SSUT16]|uniref:Uncharacterized protein n=1 Tax=Bosea spartocytisi TaxID=2773451 RepID=A0A927E8P3_9HYPH|nr:hypothetical protein [Bosea spartocytisi]MBD3844921.1 hypothetical protein [Bosea spartocytisi]MCT4471122.1 hypothetical protein [Bosea spartocytisi]
MKRYVSVKRALMVGVLALGLAPAASLAQDMPYGNDYGRGGSYQANPYSRGGNYNYNYQRPPAAGGPIDNGAPSYRGGPGYRGGPAYGGGRAYGRRGNPYYGMSIEQQKRAIRNQREAQKRAIKRGF